VVTEKEKNRKEKKVKQKKEMFLGLLEPTVGKQVQTGMFSPKPRDAGKLLQGREEKTPEKKKGKFAPIYQVKGWIERGETMGKKPKGEGERKALRQGELNKNGHE